MKTSARNAFAGKVSKVIPGAVNTEVELTTAAGNKIVAIITNTSAETLALKEGKSATALLKASWIILGKELHAAKISTRNVLCGTISSIKHGAVNTEISVALPGGETLTGIITEGSTHTLGFQEKEHVCAAFKASSVILAVE